MAEDELVRSAPLERIFPTAETYKYLKFTDSPRYYNRLMDAWETRYSTRRQEGIELLRGFCKNKYHLQVPTPPAKKVIIFVVLLLSTQCLFYFSLSYLIIESFTNIYSFPINYHYNYLLSKINYFIQVICCE